VNASPSVVHVVWRSRGYNQTPTPRIYCLSGDVGLLLLQGKITTSSGDAFSGHRRPGDPLSIWDPEVTTARIVLPLGSTPLLRAIIGKRQPCRDRSANANRGGVELPSVIGMSRDGPTSTGEIRPFPECLLSGLQGLPVLRFWQKMSLPGEDRGASFPHRSFLICHILIWPTASASCRLSASVCLASVASHSAHSKEQCSDFVILDGPPLTATVSSAQSHFPSDSS
jgi:hypothetical protein